MKLFHTMARLVDVKIIQMKNFRTFLANEEFYYGRFNWYKMNGNMMIFRKDSVTLNLSSDKCEESDENPAMPLFRC